jgi:hypothetical protein
MRVRKTHAAALALAGALVVTAATPTLALDRWGAAGVGFAAGAVVGATAANSGYYYGPGYAYAPSSYDPYGYAYAPNAGYAYAPSAGYAYGPSGDYAYAAAPTYAGPTYYAPAYRRGQSAHAPYFDPENGSDPDPRIGGSVKMNSSGDD